MFTAIHLELATGPDVTKRFLEHNNLELIVRSHEVRSAGLDRQRHASRSSLLGNYAYKHCSALSQVVYDIAGQG